MANIDVQVILSAVDRASGTLKQFGNTAQGVHNKFANLVQASTAASFAFAGVLAITGKSIIDVASDMQQAKVGFTTMLGSADLATKTLKELSDFAKKTPFTFPSIVEASQRLLAYNIQAEDLIPTLTTLGNIASGVGMEKMPQLILAFGQVKAATRLTGMELRQFSEAGVPLLQALVDQANKAGGVLTTIGGTSTKTREKIESLNTTLQKQNNRLAEMSAAGKTSSATYKNLELSISKTRDKLADIGPISDGVTKRVKVTASQMKDMISDGEISFDQVKMALESIGGEQGKWGDLMEKQSKTFAGRLSNIQDQLVRVALNIGGISTEAETFGEVIEGGAFDILSKAVQKVLDILNELEPKIQGFIKAFVENQTAIGAVIGILVGGLLGAAVAMSAFLIPLIALMAIGAAVGAAIGFVVQHFDEWKQAIINTWEAIKTFFVDTIPTAIGNVVTSIIGWFSQLPQAIQDFFYVLFTEKIPFAVGFVAGFLSVKIPEIVNNIVKWFSELPGKALKLFNDVKDNIIKKIEETWTFINGEVSTWPTKIEKFLDTLPAKIGKIFEDLKEAVKGWLFDKADSAWNTIKSFGQQVIGIFNGIVDAVNKAIDAVKRGFDAGKQAGGGRQAGGIVPGPIDSPQMVLAHGGEEIVPVGARSGSGGGSGSVIFNVHIGMYAGSEIEKRNIASELYSSLVRLAGAQNKTVQELLGA